MRSEDIYKLPKGLPIPEDDGACNHLTNFKLPKTLKLATTSDAIIDLGSLSGITVIFCYPRTGTPDKEMPDGWEQIPGARGCTPQSCAFRDYNNEFKQIGASIYGLSTQTTEYQKEAAERLHLPFQLLSDDKHSFNQALNLPTFTVDNMKLIQRLTLVLKDNKIIKVFYPVFPPDENPAEVLEYVSQLSL
jgi:peroxiredoxin